MNGFWSVVLTLVFLMKTDTFLKALEKAGTSPSRTLHVQRTDLDFVGKTCLQLLKVPSITEVINYVIRKRYELPNIVDNLKYNFWACWSVTVHF